MVVGSSSRKQKAVQENDEDLEFEDIELESKEEEIMVNFEESDGEEGEGDAPLPYDNNEDDYVGIGEDDQSLNLYFALCIMFLSFSYFELFNEFIWC